MTEINQQEQLPLTPDNVAVEVEDKAEGNSFGKFRTGQDLLNAYNALEAEFTRRSQRIKELEGELNAKIEDDKWTEKVKDLNSKYPVARGLEKELTGYLESNSHLLKQDDCLEKALLHVLAERYGANRNESSPAIKEAPTASVDELLSRDTGENIDVESYATRAAAPKIPSSGGEIPVVPTHRPSSVREAGKLATEQFKKLKGE